MASMPKNMPRLLATFALVAALFMVAAPPAQATDDVYAPNGDPLLIEGVHNANGLAAALRAHVNAQAIRTAARADRTASRAKLEAQFEGKTRHDHAERIQEHETAEETRENNHSLAHEEKVQAFNEIRAKFKAPEDASMQTFYDYCHPKFKKDVDVNTFFRQITTKNTLKTTAKNDKHFIFNFCRGARLPAAPAPYVPLVPRAYPAAGEWAPDKAHAAHPLHVVVVGGGPAGMLSALAAYRGGADKITVLEQRKTTTLFTRHNQLLPLLDAMKSGLPGDADDITAFVAKFLEDKPSVSINSLEVVLRALLLYVDEDNTDARENVIDFLEDHEYIGTCEHDGKHVLIVKTPTGGPHVPLGTCASEVDYKGVASIPHGGRTQVQGKGGANFNGLALHADLYIGADGAHSAMRQSVYKASDVLTYAPKTGADAGPSRCYLSFVFSNVDAKLLTRPAASQALGRGVLVSDTQGRHNEKLTYADHKHPWDAALPTSVAGAGTFATRYGMRGTTYHKAITFSSLLGGQEDRYDGNFNLHRTNEQQKVLHWVTGVACNRKEQLTTDLNTHGKDFLEALFKDAHAAVDLPVDGATSLTWANLINKASRSQGGTAKEWAVLSVPLYAIANPLQEMGDETTLLVGDAARVSHFVSGSGVKTLAGTMRAVKGTVENMKAEHTALSYGKMMDPTYVFFEGRDTAQHQWTSWERETRNVMCNYVGFQNDWDSDKMKSCKTTPADHLKWTPGA